MSARKTEERTIFKPTQS